MSEIKLDINRIKHNLETVANLYNDGNEGYTRLAFSKEENQAIEWVKKELESYGASVRKDKIGNLYGRIGPDNTPAIAFGSHLDTVKHGGLFDGALGVFTGLECIRVLKECKLETNTAYELIVFKGEEGNPLGGTFGSRTVTGQIDPKIFDETLLKSLNVSREDIIDSLNTLPEYKTFIELHIEQGTVLESNENKTGIVTNIAGISRSHIIVKGTPGHSGTMPMNSRNDALVKASEIVIHIHNEAQKLTNGTVATVGQLNVHPNLATVIPGDVEFTFEVRSGEQQNINTFEKKILDWITNNYNVEIKPLVKKKANKLSVDVRERIKDAAVELNIPTMELVSGANHDANSLTKHTNVGMIFVPSIDGISHNPKENSEWKYIHHAAKIMLQTLINYSKK